MPKKVPMTSLPADVRGFAQRYTAAWCSRNAASVAAFFSPQGSLAINGGPPSVGRDAIEQAAQEFMTAFPDLQVLLDDVVIQGGRAFFHWTLIGTNLGPGGTGRRVRISGFEQWQFAADGLIGQSQGNFDNADYQHQLQHGSPQASPS